VDQTNQRPPGNNYTAAAGPSDLQTHSGRGAVELVSHYWASNGIHRGGTFVLPGVLCAQNISMLLFQTMLQERIIEIPGPGLSVM